MWLLAHVLGLDSGSGRWYLWWSGAGSDLGEVAIVAAIWHHLNCHEPHCWRLARYPVAGTTWKACRKHHPEPPAPGLYLGSRPGRG